MTTRELDKVNGQIGIAEANGTPRWFVTFDTFHSKYYLVYYNYTTNTVYQYSGTAGSWSTRTQLFTTVGGNSTMSIATYCQAGRIDASKFIVGIFYMESPSPSTKTSIKFAQEILPD